MSTGSWTGNLRLAGAPDRNARRLQYLRDLLPGPNKSFILRDTVRVGNHIYVEKSQGSRSGRLLWLMSLKPLASALGTGVNISPTDEAGKYDSHPNMKGLSSLLT
jgi:hypothetical protein